MIFFRTVFLVTLLSALGACAGFEPLYAQNTSVRSNLNQLSLAPIEGRAGFLFADAMMNRGGIKAGQSGAYVLETKLSKSQTYVGVRVDNVSTRARLTLIANYVVRDKDGKVAYTGTSTSIAAFDVPDQPYGALVAEQGAEESAARILAEKVINDLAIFFASNREAS
jgi:LPS-assembly lipoprotein